MVEPRRNPPKPVRRDSEPAERSRGRPAALAAGTERHSGEGAASAWEMWKQLEQRRAKVRGDAEAIRAPGAPRRKG